MAYRGRHATICGWAKATANIKIKILKYLKQIVFII